MSTRRIIFTTSNICQRRIFENGFRRFSKPAVSSSSFDNDFRKLNFSFASNGSDRMTDERSRIQKFLVALVFASGSIYAFRKYYDEITEFGQSKLFISAAKNKKDAAPEKPPLTSRELRFLNFASVEYEGQIFMTPRDFLDSVTQMQANPRPKRRELTDDQVKEMLQKTPTFNKASIKLFRHLNDNGLISYTEYLFLLCVLTKPTTGFRIAFNMFDTDGNQRVDKKEFLVIQALTLILRTTGKNTDLDTYLDSIPRKMLQLVRNTTLHLRKACQKQLETDICQHTLETIFASSRREKRELQLRQYEKNAQTDNLPKEEGGVIERTRNVASDPAHQQDSAAAILMDSHRSILEKTEKIMELMRVQDTTLLVHFFGSKGDKVLAYDEFHSFMENLQTEVLEIEFFEFSQGKPTITESDFASILLRYTVARPDDYKAYINRVHRKIPDSKGITFDQFRQFCRFLTFLDDFTIAVKLYTFADAPVTQPEFARAVKVSTGYALDPHVLDTVFQIFDVNNDGRLSYSEFISIMRDRLNRGFRTHLVEKQGWDAFKQCIRAEMKRY